MFQDVRSLAMAAPLRLRLDFHGHVGHVPLPPAFAHLSRWIWNTSSLCLGIPSGLATVLTRNNWLPHHGLT